MNQMHFYYLIEIEQHDNKSSMIINITLSEKNSWWDIKKKKIYYHITNIINFMRTSLFDPMNYIE